MAKKAPHTRERHKVKFPGGPTVPEDFLHFVQWDSFVKDWKRLGLGDDDLTALEMTIMVGPKRAPVVSGAGGVRKLRFAPPAWSRGKRGSLRICYVYFEDFAMILLLMAYEKNEQDDLGAAEKAAIKRLIEDIEAHLNKG